MSTQKPKPITELSDELGLSGEIRTWFIQACGLDSRFPKVIKDGVLHADLEQVLGWFEDQGLDHLLIQSGYYADDQEGDQSDTDEDGSESEENDDEDPLAPDDDRSDRDPPPRRDRGPLRPRPRR